MHTRANDYKLTLVLVPFRRYHSSGDFFEELKNYLKANGIDYIDLFEEFRTMRVGPDQVYWEHDGHMSPSGNRLVADILVRRLADRRADTTSSPPCRL
jgi:hypothetical protein